MSSVFNLFGLQFSHLQKGDDKQSCSEMRSCMQSVDHNAQRMLARALSPIFELIWKVSVAKSNCFSCSSYFTLNTEHDGDPTCGFHIEQFSDHSAVS